MDAGCCRQGQHHSQILGLQEQAIIPKQSPSSHYPIDDKRNRLSTQNLLVCLILFVVDFGRMSCVAGDVGSESSRYFCSVVRRVATFTNLRSDRIPPMRMRMTVKSNDCLNLLNFEFLVMRAKIEIGIREIGFSSHSA